MTSYASLPLPGMPEPGQVVPVTQLSDTQRLTIRQAKDIKGGRHPLTGGALHEYGDRGAYSKQPPSLSRQPYHCGSCIHRVILHPKDYPYPKCNAWGSTNGPATDVRAWWPACPRWEGETP